MRKTTGLILCAITLVPLSLILLTIPAGAKITADPGQKGLYEVGFTFFMAFDVDRDSRPVPVYVWYPVNPEDVNNGTLGASYPMDPVSNVWPEVTSSEWEAFGLERAYHEPPPSSDGPFPVVLFSPGFGGTAWTYIFVGARLASHGFVVAATTHYADGFYPWEPFDHVAVASLNRPLDVSFMLDELLDRNATPGDLLFNVLRPDQVAASGHSLGGYAAMTLAAGDDEVCDTFYLLGIPDPPPSTCVPSLPDGRIKAIVPLDGSNQFLQFYELARIDVPTMGIGQEWENVGSWQARQHAAIPAQPSYRVDLNNSQHSTSFANSCQAIALFGAKGFWPSWYVEYLLDNFCRIPDLIPPAEAQRLITQYMVAFLKTELMGESGYQRLLTPGWAITVEQDIEFFVTEKTNPHAVDDYWPCCFMYFPNQPGSERERAEKDPQLIPQEKRVMEFP